MLQVTKCISIFPFRLYLCKLIEMINRCTIAMFKRYFDQKVRGRITPSNRTDYKLNHRKKSIHRPNQVHQHVHGDRVFRTFIRAGWS